MGDYGCHLLDLPHEVLHTILRQVDLFSLGPLSCTCTTLNFFIKNNTLLFKELYLSNFDDPQKKEPHGFDWERELPRVIRLHKILLSQEIYQKSSNLAFISDAITSLLQVAHFTKSSGKDRSSRNVAFLEDMFKDSLNVDTILCCSSLFEKAGTVMHIPAQTESERQQSAKLHCLYGVPVCASTEDQTATHPWAKAKVYDIRRYTERTMWGPFTDDGTQTTDWEKVEAVMVDLAHNMNTFHKRTDGAMPVIWSDPWRGAVPHSFSSPRISNLTKQPCIPLASQDPYGVSGTWMRIVCFLDYTDFFAYNFGFQRPPLDDEFRPIHTEEAIRLICMKFKVSHIEPPGESDGTDLPVVYFEGTSHSLHAAWDPNANSDIRGSVRLTPEGEVRWTTFSIYSGEERWRSEGIQVGGVQSARGVFGNWFDKDYDARGPAGPTAFWKLTDEVSEGRVPRMHNSNEIANSN